MTRRRAAAVLALPPLVIAAAPAAVGSSGSGAAAATTTFGNVCEFTVGGRTLDIGVLSYFTTETSNDLSRVRIRATDSGERGTYRSSHVEVTRARITVHTKSGRTIVKTGTTSPLSVKLDPTSRRSGRDALFSRAKVTFKVTGKNGRTTTRSFSCADIDA